MMKLAQIVLLAALAPAAYSQSVIHTFNGDSIGDEFGWAVSGAGDVNGDGYPDLIVGTLLDVINGVWVGSARIHSGWDGSEMYTLAGNGGLFGWAVSGAGDVNGDGYDDVIVGATHESNNGIYTGSARVFSGMDGSVLYLLYGDKQYESFGSSVSGAGDVNGDGFDDFLIGTSDDDNNGTNSGSARVFSGLDGSVVYTFDGDSPHDHLGASVSGAGDVNGDGFDDVIAGAFGDDSNGQDTGSARVFSGANGAVLYTFSGDSAGDRFGEAVRGAGDVNADGFADVIVGAPWDDNNGSASGTARVFSGMDGNVLYTFEGDSSGDYFGGQVDGAGDVNGDGYADLIVGFMEILSDVEASGYIRVFSGEDGSTLYTLGSAPVNDRFGWSLGGAGDVNGDGFDDLIVGAAGGNGNSFGYVRVFSGWTVVGTNFCTATPNSSGSPASIGASGSQSISENVVILSTEQVAPDQFGYYLVSDTQAFVPGFGGSQGNLCLGPPIKRFSKAVKFSGTAGVITLQLDLTSLPQGTVFQPGETWNFQLWFRDVNPGSTSNTSDGLAITFQ